MKVIFLDVDGVLNTGECKGAPGKGKEGREGFVYDKSSTVPFLRRCLDNLETILVETGARIVVTSTWRLVPDLLASLTRVVSDFGPRLIIGITSDRSENWDRTGRGDEVRQWLKENNVCDKFVILDDEHTESFEGSLFSERAPPYGSQGLLITTKMNGRDFSELGLTRKHVSKVIEFLNLS